MHHLRRRHSSLDMRLRNGIDKATTKIFGLPLPARRGSDVHQLFDDANNQLLRVEQVFKLLFGASDQTLRHRASASMSKQLRTTSGWIFKQA